MGQVGEEIALVSLHVLLSCPFVLPKKWLVANPNDDKMEGQGTKEDPQLVWQISITLLNWYFHLFSMHAWSHNYMCKYV
jgi:hypothetical protein